MSIGSLFSGIGGLELGLERAGLGPVLWQCEVDPYCRAVLAKHWPSAERYPDVRTLGPHAPGLDTRVRMDYLRGGDASEEVVAQLKKMTPDQVLESVRMYESGLSLAPIAEYYGVSRQSMWDLLRRRITLRPQRRAGSDNHFFRGGAAEDERAHDLVEHAIRRGALHRPAECEACGSSGTFSDGRSSIQAHHDDYNKPMTVRWLCQRCHHEWHQHNRAVPRTEEGKLPHVDVICGGFP